MPMWRWNRYFPAPGVRLLLVGALTAVALLKFLGGRGPERDMTALQIGPQVATAIAIFELALAAALLSPFWHKALWGTLLFSLLALTYLLLLRWLEIDVRTCGCFGARRVGLAGHVAVLTGILVVSAYALVAWQRPTHLERTVLPRA
jgi:hypothetical protein